jgi:anti-sigma factor RsiW
VNCQETQTLLHAYVDGELEMTANLEIEQHLQACPACAQAHVRLQELQRTLQTQLPYHTPPRQLRLKMQTALRRAGRRGGSARRLATPRWLAVAACVAVVLLGGWALATVLAPPSRPEGDIVVRELVAAHIRSLMVPKHQLDVESSDRHTVKPWFKGKIDFAPTVQDFSQQGFPLLGGRLDYLDNRPVAVLVYKRRDHPINLFLWPLGASSSAVQSTIERQGYHLVHWTQAGMNYWAVSDLDVQELQDFARLVQTSSN